MSSVEAAEKQLLPAFPIAVTLRDHLEGKGEGLTDGKEVDAGGGCGQTC